MTMKKKLLIVDDEEILCNSLKTFLSIKGYEVVTALNGAEAFKLIEEFNPGFVLLDLCLPGEFSGLDILKKAKAARPDLKVVMITGSGRQDEIEKECSRLGAGRFLYKPLTADEMKNALDQV